jgi:hypothetical protein
LSLPTLSGVCNWLFDFWYRWAYWGQNTASHKVTVTSLSHFDCNFFWGILTLPATRRHQLSALLPAFYYFDDSCLFKILIDIFWEYILKNGLFTRWL